MRRYVLEKNQNYVSIVIKMTQNLLLSIIKFRLEWFLTQCSVHDPGHIRVFEEKLIDKREQCYILKKAHLKKQR